MTWYTYPFPDSAIVKDASKKHYYRSSITYSITIKFISDDSASEYLKYQVSGDTEKAEWRPPGNFTISGTSTSTGSMHLITSKKVYDGSQSYAFYWRMVSYSFSMNYGSKAVPVATSTFASGFIDPAKSKEISFGMQNISGIDEQYSIRSGVLYYKKSTDSGYHSLSFSGKNVTIPAGTLVTGNAYNMYAVLTLDDGSTCQYNFGSISTVDGDPSVVAKTPNNVVIYGSTAFSWEYANTRSTVQYAYDVQIAKGGGAYTTIFNHVVSSASVSPEYSGITAGTYSWRVRAYNNDDVASAWSYGSFVCNVPPEPPEITEVVPGGRIEVKWTASDQTGYRAQIVDTSGSVVYDSGDVYSISGNALLNYYLPDGDYTVRVKVMNIFGLESEYSEFHYTQAQELTAPEVTADFDEQTGMEFMISNGSLFEKYYLIRNGEVVAKHETASFVDPYSNGQVRYTIIAVDASDRFGKAEISRTIKRRSSWLIRKTGEHILVSRRFGNRFETTQAEDTRYEAAEYLGATRPKHYFSKMRTNRFSIVFHDTGNAKELLGEVLFFADSFGNGEWVVPVTRSRTDHWFGDDTQLDLEMTDGEEVIEYDL